MVTERHLGENQTAKNVASEYLNTLSSPNSGFNRKDRRLFKQIGRRIKTIGLPRSDKLISEEQILTREDDLPFLTVELTQYISAQSRTVTELHVYNLLRQLGVTDEACRKFIVNPNPENMNVAVEIFGTIRTKDKRLLSKTMDTFKTMISSRNKSFYDPDEKNLINSLIDDGNINGKDILVEVIRARQESIDLMKMQIDWLREKQAASSKQKANGQDEDIDDSLEIEDKPGVRKEPLKLPETSVGLSDEIRQQFLLENWDLFITKSPWSSNPNHLTSIPTSSRQETLDAVKILTQGKASVKPTSVLNALEFHLRKDVIQRALATRLKYGPAGIKDWVKIKRGRDRIFFLIPNLAKTEAIFFVEGRDEVYESA